MIEACHNSPQAKKARERARWDKCVALEAEWFLYVTAHRGAEWDWPEREAKAACKKQFLATFPIGIWATAEYCRENIARLRQAAKRSIRERCEPAP
jgi:hypothetical protein